MALVQEKSFQHPYQGSVVRLVVYDQPADTSPVEGMPDAAGFLVTEEWHGAGNVVKTLGFYDGRAAALERMQARARELEAQRYRPLAPAA